MPKSDSAYKVPHDRSFDPLKVVATGIDSNRKLSTTWELDVSTSELILTNELGASFSLGKVARPVVRCSLAFLEYTKPFIVLNFEEGDAVIFRVDLKNASMIETDIDTTGLQSVALFYNAGYSYKNLTVCAIGKEGMMFGTTNGYSRLDLALRIPLEDPENHFIDRFALTTDNQIVAELFRFTEPT